MSKPRYTEAESAYITEHYGKMPLREIAAKLGRTYSGLRAFARYHGLQGQHGGRRVYKVDHERVLRLYAIPTMTAKMIAEEVGCKENTVMRIAADHDVKSPRNRANRKMTEAERTELLAYYAGHTIKQTAEVYGVSKGTMQSRLARAMR